jgi:hypothetical protein
MSEELTMCRPMYDVRSPRERQMVADEALSVHRAALRAAVRERRRGRARWRWRWPRFAFTILRKLAAE